MLQFPTHCTIHSFHFISFISTDSIKNSTCTSMVKNLQIKTEFRQRNGEPVEGIVKSPRGLSGTIPYNKMQRQYIYIYQYKITYLN